MTALLFAVFAMHSEATGHDMHTAGSSTPAGASAPVEVAAVGVAWTAPVVASLSAGTHNGMLDCALLAMACVLLLVLIALVFLTRLPATYRRLRDAGGALLRVVDLVVVPLPRPSLTVLSISRV
ncbi:hypothetical protein [Cryobacterium roopkundense]|uniref:Uncharacterized membrane protein YhaH (DUF805 family) n=1 Tax=Cryobacterium roopkundense TaxID=1001240 RepID=A0A7W8ZVN6_9MICO|nr:hypothetical protein [Cryobacterium roopkundense]MBB5641088.1 uncharacterized membrane protein YhaH (DUF805 family) [Cryobacterium roopkundense]